MPNSTGSAQRGAKKAIRAVAASIFTAIFNMPTDGSEYHDLGHDHSDRCTKATQTRRLVARLESLRYAVAMKPLAA